VSVPVSAGADYARFAEVLKAATGPVVVCGHVDPDGDAIGSTLGLTLALRRLGIEAAPALAEHRQAAEMYGFLAMFDQLRPASQLEAPALLVALDTPNPERLGDAASLIEAAGDVITIDHHPDNTGYGSTNLVDPSAAATGQIVWRLLPLLGIQPDAELAAPLYVALLTDSGRFQFSNSNATVLRDAASMLDHGLDAHAIYERIYENQSLAHIELVGLVKAREKLANNGRVAYSWVTDEDFETTGATRESTENLVDAIRVIGGVDVVFLAKISSGRCRVSLRAKGHGDVGGVARHFGGGGHVAAAGFTFGCDLEELLPLLLAQLPGAEGI
jgi:phosphoesterase RecJ-like protein